MSASVIDCDQHLVETPHLWRDHVDPAGREDALRITRDTRGYDWLTWRNEAIAIADLHQPGDVDAIGRLRDRFRRGLPAEERATDTATPRGYWDPASRVAQLDEMDVAEAVVFPNFGLDAWYTDAVGDVDPVLASVFIWAPAALACTDLILNGVLARHPDLRIGCFEASPLHGLLGLPALRRHRHRAWRLCGRRTRPDPQSAHALFHDNIALLLRR